MKRLEKSSLFKKKLAHAIALRPNGSFYEESSMICVPVAVILAAIGLVLEIIRLLLG